MIFHKGFACFACTAFAVICTFAQDAQPSKLTHKAVEHQVSSAPVTQAEARAIFKRAEKNLEPLTRHKMPFGAESIADSGQPVTREQVLTEFSRLFKGLQPYFKFTPRPEWFDPSVLTVKPGHALNVLDEMIQFGFVARVGPLATSTSDTMNVKDFGDSVGIFLARAADLTHMPKTGYTPFLEGV